MHGAKVKMAQLV